jgi:hypothetical protein
MLGSLIQSTTAQVLAVPELLLLIAVQVIVSVRNDSLVRESLFETDLREVVDSSQLIEAHNTINRDSFLEHDDAWKHLDLELCHEKWRLRSVYLDEFCLRVFSCYYIQVLVHDFATLKVWVEEVSDDGFGCRDLLQEIFFLDLQVLSMPA